MSETLDPEQLLADSAWLNRLARNLADTAADADDLAQESWLALWRRRPETDRSLRPWLVKVARDLANMKRRGDRRRSTRELAVEPAQEATPPDVLLEQMRLHRLIVDLVLELEEPYRSTVISRFVEGRSAADIARSLDVPESTIRGRLHEALARLRAGLDVRTGERKAWAPAVLAFTQKGVLVTKTTKSTLLIVLLLVMAIVGIVAVPRVLRHTDESTPPQAAAPGLTMPERGVHATGEPPAPAWFGVRGAPPRRIAGRVSIDDRPVAGADVTLYSQLVISGLRAPEHRKTAADGTFDFGPRTVAYYQVIAEAPDRVAAVEVVDLADPLRKPPPDQLELRMQGCRAAVAGTIFDASGGVIAKARVRRDGLAGVVADERGAYKVCVPYGDAQLEYSADGYGSVVIGLDVRGDQRHDIVLVPEGTIAVRVVRAGDNTPVSGAAVFANPQEWGRDRPQNASAITDADGRARLTRLVPGPYRVFGFADGMQTQSPVAAVAEVGTGIEVILRMDATARITGTVVAHGKPVGGASVVATRAAPLAYSPPSFTGADGAFALERVSVGDIRFSAFPYDVKSPATIHVEARTYDHVVIEVEALGSIRGRVTRNGKPLADVDVCCVRSDTSPPQQRTDATGRYEFRGVPEGAYDIGSGSDELGAFAFSKKLKLARGEHAIVDLELDQAGAIGGTVVDKQGQPVAGVFVRWIQEASGDIGRCATDARGRYRCGALAGGGKYRAAVFPVETRTTPYATADGKPYPVVEVKDAATVIEDATIAIDYRRLSISGRVVDTAGAAVADAEVRALAVGDNQPAVFRPWDKLPSTFTAVDGSFTITELVPGTHALQARSPDGGEGTVARVEAGATTVVVKLERPGAIAGKLAGFSAAPVVFARALNGSERAFPAVVDGATFQLTGLRPGRYVVSAQTASEGDAQIAEVRAGATTQLVLTSRGRGAVDGTVMDFRTRAPLVGAACHATMVVDGEQTIMNWDPATSPRSDAQGRVTIDPAPAGSIQVHCLMNNYKWSEPAIVTVLAPGGRATVRLLSVELTTENPGAPGIQLDPGITAARIWRLAPNTPAAASGLVAGDVITAIDNARVDEVSALGVLYLIDSHASGSEISITVARGKTYTFTVGAHSHTH